MEDDLVGDDLDIARLEGLAQVELGVFGDGSKGPAKIE